MSNTESWTHRNRSRERDDATARRPSMTLGEWLDAMSDADDDGDQNQKERPGRRRRTHIEDDSHAGGRIFRSALAELDARERRMERRADDMLDALDRWVSKGERTAPDRRPAETSAAPRFDQALDQIERRLEDIATRIEKRVSAASLNPAAGPANHPELDARLADIARRIDEAHAARRSDPEDRERLTRLETHLETLVRRLESQSGDAPAVLNGPRRRTRPSIAEATAEIRAHQLKLDEPAPSVAPADALNDKLAAIAERLEKVETRAVNALAPAVDTMRADIAALAAKLSQPPAPTIDVAPLQAQIASLGARIDATRSQTNLESQMAALREAVVSAVRERDPVSTGDPSRLLDSLESRIDAAGDRISNDVRNQMQGAIIELRHALDAQAAAQNIAPIAEAVQDLTNRFDTAYARRDDGTTLTRIETQVSRLSARFENLAAESATTIDSGQLERLTNEIRAAAQEINPASAVAKIEDRLQAMDAKLEDVKRPVVVTGKNGAKVAAELTGLEGMIRTLTDRMEAARAEQASSAHFEDLHHQIRSIASKLDQIDDSPALTTIERSVSDLFAQIDTLRQERDASTAIVARQAAEAAAREVADDLVRRAAADLADASAPRINALVEDMSELRRTTDLVDRKTHETLEAIHGALAKIVERMGALEQDQRRPAAPAPAAQPHEDEPPAASARRGEIASPPAAPAPSIEADAPLTARLTGRRQAAIAAEAPAKSRFSIKLPFMNRGEANSPAPAPRRAETPAAAESRIEAADRPLEPGSGRPAAPIAKPSDAAATAKASFIAAARRAAQTATAEVEAKRASAERDANPTPSAIAARKKPILIGLAALLLAVLALGAATRFSSAPPRDEKLSSAPIERSAASGRIAAQPPAAPLTPDVAVSTKDSPTPTATAPAADPTVVGSIPEPIQLPPAPAVSRPADTGPLEIPTAIASPTLRTAALRGDPAAAHELGVRLFDGRGVGRDPKLAFKWFERAAHEGLAPAQFRVGNMYEKGVGVARDLKAAKTWYLRAAEKGNAKALHNLGVLIAEGGDGKPDYAAAGEYFLKAAKLGVRDSQYNVAILQARGLGVSQSMTEAYMWLSIAAAQGDDEAAKKRDEISQRLTPEDLSSARAAAQAFKPAPGDRLANDVPAPDKGWDAAPTAAAPRGKTKQDGAKI